MLQACVAVHPDLCACMHYHTHRALTNTLDESHTLVRAPSSGSDLNRKPCYSIQVLGGRAFTPPGLARERLLVWRLAVRVCGTLAPGWLRAKRWRARGGLHLFRQARMARPALLFAEPELPAHDHSGVGCAGAALQL